MNNTFFTVPTVPFPGWLYVLHFDQPRHHARHYLGSSAHLMQRLAQHANGQGSKLTKALWLDCQGWQLAALFIPKDPTESIRDLERRAKTRKNTAAYCPFCTRDHVAPPGTIEYPSPYVMSHTLLKGKPQ